ncbi:MAG TPA: translation initiation factor IF-2 [Candidatus Saccharimonadales bacterium]|nr:translation initiation factor IF-2 [Candidatus Saccharimonadales bacterium]
MRFPPRRFGPARRGPKRKSQPKHAGPKAPPAAPQFDTYKPLTIAEGTTVRSLAEKMGVKSNEILSRLVAHGVMATINLSLDPEMAATIAHDFGYELKTMEFEEHALLEEQEAVQGDNSTVRPPVVTIMGHVDHGKTTLLDAIRESNVVASEHGGITQHIGAYTAVTRGRSVTFLDTPGHEAFTLMRARGAQVTDIVILVVAADDGVMPQTIEAINHAKAAGVPLIVAINKMDKPDANPERVKKELADREILVESWGGDTVSVEISAKQKKGLDEILDMILLVADMRELKADPSLPASGTIIEARLDKARGAVATVLVQQGTLKVGDAFIAGPVTGRIRAMFDDKGEKVTEAGPSTPVEILGLQGVPSPGDRFKAVEDETKARQIVNYRLQKQRDEHMRKSSRMTLEHLHEQIQEGKVKELNVILKGDVQGSLEAVSKTLERLSTPEVKLRFIHQAVGAINESDVLLAQTSDAIIIGFNVRPDPNARSLADKEGVDVRLHTVIYEIADQIQKAMQGLLEPTLEEKWIGRAEVRNTFKVPKFGVVAGIYVLDGQMLRNADVRLLRDNVVVYQGKVASLRRFKDDVNEVKSGYECGLGISNFSDIKIGDVIEAFKVEKVAPKEVAI